jgi:hypothetical protein
VTVVSIFAGVVCLWGLFARRCGSVLAGNVARFAPRLLVARIGTLALVPLYAGQLSLIAMQSRYENVAPEYAWMKTLPVPVFDDRADSIGVHALLTALALVVALSESLALAAIVLTLRRQPSALAKLPLVACACLLALLSLGAPVLASTDPYEYLAAGWIGFRAYALHGGEFAHTAYAAYAAHIPVNREDYGPLWMLMDMLESKFGSSIATEIEAIRVGNTLFVVAFLWMLARARLPRVVLAAFALNPALWYYVVANPHSEIEALLFFAGVYAAAGRSRPILATAFLLAAGLIKLPFVIVGGALLVPLRDPKRRWYAWLAATALALAISYLAAGPAYFGNLSRFAENGALRSWSPDWLAIAPLLVIATALLVASERGHIGVAWFFGQMAPLAAPWYLLWGIPYALASGSVEFYLVALPLAATQAERLSAVSAVVLFVVMAILAIDNVRSRRRARDGSAHSLEVAV